MVNFYTVFVSDIHLNEQQPAITQRFIDFLELNKSSIETLYILGDLFDYWIGDDDIALFKQSISSILKKCSDSGVKIYFIHGNRDYLLGEKFAENCSMILLPEKSVINLYGKSIVLMHGDLLCTDDLAYQRYRKIMFSPIIKKICLLLPLWLRQKIAKKLRQKSQASNQKKSVYIMDVSENSVIETLKESHVDLLIHGHTHRQAIHANRIVLGAWESDSGNALIASKDQELYFIHFNKAPTIAQHHILEPRKEAFLED